MKNKYKATPKTYASQPRRNGKVTARLAGLLARADVHVEEGELKSISTGPEASAVPTYATGGVAGQPRWVNGENEIYSQNPPYEFRQGWCMLHPGEQEAGRLLRRTTFNPPLQVNAGEELILGTGRLFIGNTDDPNNLREIGTVRDVRIDFARESDRNVLVQMDFSAGEARVLNYGIQAAVSDEIARVVDREIAALALLGSRYSPQRWVVDSLAAVADSARSMSESFDSVREEHQRYSELLGYFAVQTFSAETEDRSRRKKKKDRKPHPESGKLVVRRKTRRTLLGIVVTDMRVGNGGIKRTAQLGITVQAPRRRKYGDR